MIEWLKDYDSSEPVRLRAWVAAAIVNLSAFGFTLSPDVDHKVKAGVDVAVWVLTALHLLVTELARVKVAPFHKVPGKHQATGAVGEVTVSSVSSGVTEPAAVDTPAATGDGAGAPTEDQVMAEIEQMQADTAAMEAKETPAAPVAPEEAPAAA